MNKVANSLSQWDSNSPYPQDSGPNRALQRLQDNVMNGGRGGDMGLEERRYTLTRTLTLTLTLTLP